MSLFGTLILRVHKIVIAGQSAIAVRALNGFLQGAPFSVGEIGDAVLTDEKHFDDDRTRIVSLNDGTPFEVHANYTNSDIQSHMGATSITSPGQQGVGVLHFENQRAYALLVTFQKTENEFSPSTMYADYPISAERIHWESQSNTTQASPTGQKLIRHQEKNYKILIFARERRRQPFTYLGQASHVSHESERPIKFVWQLDHPMPAEMFENCRKGG